MHIIFRVLKFALQTFWRNIWLSLVTITVLVLALLSINFILVFNYIADSSIIAIEDKIDISVSFYETVNESEVKDLKRFLEGLNTVENVLYISPQQALESFKLRHVNNQAIMDSLSELEKNPLPASLVIKATEVQDYNRILSFLGDESYIDIIKSTSFDDHREVITKIQGILLKVKHTGYAVSIIFILIAILIIFNTVRVNVYTHREEILVMKLVGASNSFVRLPFIIESALVGFLALLITIAILYPIIALIQPYFDVFFGNGFDLLLYFYENFILIFGSELAAIILLNIIASTLAVGKYLRV